MKRLIIPSIFLLILSFSSVSATSTCEPLRDEFMCSPEIVIGNVNSHQACQSLCEEADTTCCYWRSASQDCHIGNSIYFEGRGGRFAATCSVDSVEIPTNPPYINLASVFDINTTNASIGGTFLFEDYSDITAYAVLDGIPQTQTLYQSGISQYHYETFNNLVQNTTYSWDFCISYENGEICDGGGFFTTLPIINETVPTNQTCEPEIIYINNTIYINQTIDLENYTLVDNSLCTTTITAANDTMRLCLYSLDNETVNQEIRDDIASLG